MNVRKFIFALAIFVIAGAQPVLGMKNDDDYIPSSDSESCEQPKTTHQVRKPRAKKKQNVTCHFCRKQKADMTPCSGCHMTYCNEKKCLDHGRLDDLTCLYCRNECCCRKEVCNLEHKHCHAIERKKTKRLRNGASLPLREKKKRKTKDADKKENNGTPENNPQKKSEDATKVPIVIDDPTDQDPPPVDGENQKGPPAREIIVIDYEVPLIVVDDESHVPDQDSVATYTPIEAGIKLSSVPADDGVPYLSTFDLDGNNYELPNLFDF